MRSSWIALSPLDIPEGITIVAMDLQDEMDEKLVQMVSTSQSGENECLVTLDSGADISVLPKAYADVGHWAPGSTSLRMVDAQGKRTAPWHHEGQDQHHRCQLQESRDGGGVRAGERGCTPSFVQDDSSDEDGALVATLDN